MSHHSSLSKALCISLCLPVAISALATDRTWTGSGGNTLWTNRLNWSDNTVPSGNADAAIFPFGITANVLLDQSTTIKTIYFRSPGSTLTVSGGVNLAFDNLGALTLLASEDAVIDGDGSLTFSVNTGENFADN